MMDTKILHTYNDEDFSTLAASIIIPYLLEYITPKSVIDIGCGPGQWLSVFKNHGIKYILGIDGEHVPKDIRKINEFFEYDLRNIKELRNELTSRNQDKFDLCVSLEVAEHLPENIADDFIDCLTEVSNFVLFSAAIKDLGVMNHINEQPHKYWIDKFAAKGYKLNDLFRKKFWNDDNVNWWYSQNMYLFVKEGEHITLPPHGIQLWDGNMYIHPKVFYIHIDRCNYLSREYDSMSEKFNNLSREYDSVSETYNNLSRKYNNFKNSYSYKLSRFMTYIPRKIKKVFKK